MLGLQIIGLSAVIKKLNTAGKREHFEKAKKETLELAKDIAKDYAPELTGELEDSINIYGDELVADAPWAVFNEYGCYNIEVGTVPNPKGVLTGSGKFAYRPFMRPAMMRAIRMYPEILFSKLSGISKGVTSIRVGQKRV